MKSFGNRARFCLEIDYCRDPDHGKGALPEYSASWGRFALWINNKDLCANQCGGEIKEYVNWYLLPLLEWLAGNWSPLFFEEVPCIPPEKDTGRAIFHDYTKKFFSLMPEGDDQYWYEWGQRHMLRACSEGGLFPDVFIRGYGEYIEFSWENASLPGTLDDFHFNTALGFDFVKRDMAMQVFREFLLYAVQELNLIIPNSERISVLFDSVQNLKSGKDTYIEEALQWMLPAARKNSDILCMLRDKFKDFIKDLRIDFIPAPLLMFGTYAPTINSDDVQMIKNAMCHGSDSQKVTELLRSNSLAFEISPHDQGYELAMDVLDALELEEQIKTNLDAILTQLKINTAEYSFNDSNMRGIAIAGDGLQPVICINLNHPFNKTSHGKRFTQAHELCHILYDRQYGKEVGITSGPWAPKRLEKRANAFAAMFLMPENLIHDNLQKNYHGEITREFVNYLMEYFDVGYIAMVWHLFNLKAIDQIKKDELMRYSHYYEEEFFL